MRPGLLWDGEWNKFTRSIYWGAFYMEQTKQLWTYMMTSRVTNNEPREARGSLGWLDVQSLGDCELCPDSVVEYILYTSSWISYWIWLAIRAGGLIASSLLECSMENLCERVSTLQFLGSWPVGYGIIEESKEQRAVSFLEDKVHWFPKTTPLEPIL